MIPSWFNLKWPSRVTPGNRCGPWCYPAEFGSHSEEGAVCHNSTVPTKKGWLDYICFNLVTLIYLLAFSTFGLKPLVSVLPAVNSNLWLHAGWPQSSLEYNLNRPQVYASSAKYTFLGVHVYRLFISTQQLWGLWQHPQTEMGGLRSSDIFWHQHACPGVLLSKAYEAACNTF